MNQAQPLSSCLLSEATRLWNVKVPTKFAQAQARRV